MDSSTDGNDKPIIRNVWNAHKWTTIHIVITIISKVNSPPRAMHHLQHKSFPLLNGDLPGLIQYLSRSPIRSSVISRHTAISFSFKRSSLTCARSVFCMIVTLLHCSLAFTRNYNHSAWRHLPPPPLTAKAQTPNKHTKHNLLQALSRPPRLY